MVALFVVDWWIIIWNIDYHNSCRHKTGSCNACKQQIQNLRGEYAQAKFKDIKIETIKQNIIQKSTLNAKIKNCKEGLWKL